jgi:hypothetical protein
MRPFTLAHYVWFTCDAIVNIHASMGLLRVNIRTSVEFRRRQQGSHFLEADRAAVGIKATRCFNLGISTLKMHPFVVKSCGPPSFWGIPAGRALRDALEWFDLSL